MRAWHRTVRIEGSALRDWCFFWKARHLRLFLNTLLRLISGTYFVLTSIYCLLAFLPYTFFFLIKAPPYAWMPWFVHHQAALYWVAAAAAVAANWRLREVWPSRPRRFLAGAVCLGGVGAYLIFRPFLVTLEDTSKSYWWSLATLLPLVAVALWRPVGDGLTPVPTAGHRPC